MRTQTSLILSDLHLPYIDLDLQNLIKTTIKKAKIDNIIIVGDIIDCGSLTTKSKRFVQAEYLRDDLDSAKRFFSQVIGNKHKCYVLEGNHDYRITKYYKEHPEMDKIVSLKEDISSVCDIHWTPYGEVLELGWACFFHGKRTGGGTPKWYADIFSPAHCNNKPIFYGHCHTADSYYSDSGAESHGCGWCGTKEACFYAEGPIPKSHKLGYRFAVHTDTKLIVTSFFELKK